MIPVITGVVKSRRKKGSVDETLRSSLWVEHTLTVNSHSSTKMTGVVNGKGIQGDGNDRTNKARW